MVYFDICHPGLEKKSRVQLKGKVNFDDPPSPLLVAKIISSGPTVFNN